MPNQDAPKTVAEIAAGLTAAQKRALINSFLTRGGTTHVPLPTPVNVPRHLIEKKLLSRRPTFPLTPLGLAVREYLKGTQ